MDNDEAVTHTTPSGALTLIGHSSRKICVYENPQAILSKSYFLEPKSLFRGVCKTRWREGVEPKSKAHPKAR